MNFLAKLARSQGFSGNFSLGCRIFFAADCSVDFSSKGCRMFSSADCSGAKDVSPVAAYLIQRFGFDEQSAVSAAKKINLETTEKPSIVVSFLKEHKFSHSQISMIIRKCPRILASNAHKTLLPKIEFLCARFSSVEVASILSQSPVLLNSSLSKTLIPSFNFLTTLLESETHVTNVIKRCGNVLLIHPGSNAARNMETLIREGVPRSRLQYLFGHKCIILLIRPSIFEENVKEVKNLRIKPISFNFVVALRMFIGYSEQSWAKKLEIYQSYGWTEEQFMKAFRRFPNILGVSEKKIRTGFRFFMEEMGFTASVIAKYPVVIMLSLKKRIIPRSSIIKVLISNGVMSLPFNLSAVFGCSEVNFHMKYVLRYDKVPGLVKLYEQNLRHLKQTSAV